MVAARVVPPCSRKEARAFAEDWRYFADTRRAKAERDSSNERVAWRHAVVEALEIADAYELRAKG